MTLQYTLVGTDDGQNITVFTGEGAPLVAHSSHPNFDKIVEGVLAKDASVIDLFDVATSAATKFNRLTDRVSTANGHLYLDHEEVHNSLATQVVRFLSEKVEDWKPLVAFFENVQSNPQEHSRTQLYDWLAKRDFTITPDGLIVGYKSVYKLDDGGFKSVMSGNAIVNGEVQKGHIVQGKGDVVEMPRGDVQHDPSVGCHTGLHVGSYDYAKDFSGDTILEIHVNPRDVVSVPTDCDWAKVRTCRYTVVDTIEKPYESAVSYDHYEDENNDEDLLYGEQGDFAYADRDEDYDPDWLPANYTSDEQEIDDLEVAPADYKRPMALADAPRSVQVGDVFRTTDNRKGRAGTQFKVESIEGDTAVGKSLPRNLTRKVALDRLTSYRYRKV